MAETPQHTFQTLTKRADRMAELTRSMPVLPNAWLGVSVENADFFPRLDHLRSTPAAVRFVSLEPLLGSVADVDLTSIDWAIVGGESGPKARPIKEEWVREIRATCTKYGTAFFFKQWAVRTKSGMAGLSTAEPTTSSHRRTRRPSSEPQRPLPRRHDRRTENGVLIPCLVTA